MGADSMDAGRLADAAEVMKKKAVLAMRTAFEVFQVPGCVITRSFV
jgi:hypothetical protein